LYMQQRYYDSGLGLFVSVDPMASDFTTGWNFNRYNYAANNPYRFTDPDGMQTVGEWLDIRTQQAADETRGKGGATVFGFAFASTAWRYLGAEGVSQVADKGSESTAGDRFGAGLEILSALPPVKAARGVATLVDEGAAALNALPGPVIVGESMHRVEAAAASYPGAVILNNMPDFKAMGMNPDQVTSAMMAFNRKWILEQMRSGRTIIDIGTDPARKIPSIFYQMEQAMLRNYQKLHPEFGGAASP
jgi:hypothetical protein